MKNLIELNIAVSELELNCIQVAIDHLLEMQKDLLMSSDCEEAPEFIKADFLSRVEACENLKKCFGGF